MAEFVSSCSLGTEGRFGKRWVCTIPTRERERAKERERETGDTCSTVGGKKRRIDHFCSGWYLPIYRYFHYRL
eukprot:3837407-Amphidinium_carterae.1